MEPHHGAQYVQRGRTEGRQRETPDGSSCVDREAIHCRRGVPIRELLTEDELDSLETDLVAHIAEPLDSSGMAWHVAAAV
jgi:hypothetical protein